LALHLPFFETLIRSVYTYGCTALIVGGIATPEVVLKFETGV
jgi:hypothetical protein